MNVKPIQTHTIWDELRIKLPWRKGGKNLEIRIKQWDAIDVSGNGYLSLKEVTIGLRDVVQLPVIFNLKPVVKRAFITACSKVPSKNKGSNEFIGRAEYRFFLKYLRQYYEYWVAFDRIDTNDDRKVSK